MGTECHVPKWMSTTIQTVCACHVSGALSGTMCMSPSALAPRPTSARTATGEMPVSRNIVC